MRDKVIAVTAMSRPGWTTYGRKFVETFARLGTCPLRVYSEHVLPKLPRGIVCNNILMAEGITEFLLACPEVPPSHYTMDARRFCWKAFAQLATFDAADYVFWIDADVVLRQAIPVEYLMSLVDGVALTFLGRSTYTETGFVGFNTRHEDFSRFRSRYERLYVEQALFALPAWTDAHAFDYCRPGIASRNLTPDGVGFEDVFRKSCLGEYMDHLKGNRKHHWSSHMDVELQPRRQ